MSTEGKLYRVREDALGSGNINEDANLSLVRIHGYIWVGPHELGNNKYYKSLATGEPALWYRYELDLLEE